MTFLSLLSAPYKTVKFYPRKRYVFEKLYLIKYLNIFSVCDMYARINDVKRKDVKVHEGLNEHRITRHFPAGSAVRTRANCIRAADENYDVTLAAGQVPCIDSSFFTSARVGANFLLARLQRACRTAAPIRY